MRRDGNQGANQLSASGKRRVGLAVQGGVVPAGAFATGVIRGLIDAKAFETYDIRAFSGTSAGAVIATLCWYHTAKGTIENLGDDLVRQWTYLQWPRHLAWLPIWTPATARMWNEVDALAMKFSPWRLFVERVRTPFIRWIMSKWIQDLIPIAALEENAKRAASTPSRSERTGLAIAAADVLRGEIKIFREDNLSLQAVLASGSLDEMGGVTTILTPPNAGTYLDGAWADNPPINELLDYALDEIWVIQCFPKTIANLPRTPSERRERKDELWQNSLVEHELEFVEFVKHWHDAINTAIPAQIARLQKAGANCPVATAT